MCWSYDKSKLAISNYPDPHVGEIAVLNLDSRSTHEIESVDSWPPNSNLTSQCWAPGGTEFVYAVKGAVNIFDINQNKSRKLAEGSYPTWSPDGRWIAFLDHDKYFAIRPSGEGRKKLFHKKNTKSGLWWSPDSRFVAYVSQASIFEQWGVFDIELYMLRIRRLADGSELAFHEEVGLGGGSGSYQWVENPNFIRQVESQAAK